MLQCRETCCANSRRMQSSCRSNKSIQAIMTCSLPAPATGAQVQALREQFRSVHAAKIQASFRRLRTSRRIKRRNLANAASIKLQQRVRVGQSIKRARVRRTADENQLLFTVSAECAFHLPPPRKAQPPNPYVVLTVVTTNDAGEQVILEVRDCVRRTRYCCRPCGALMLAPQLVHSTAFVSSPTASHELHTRRTLHSGGVKLLQLTNTLRGSAVSSRCRASILRPS